MGVLFYVWIVCATGQIIKTCAVAVGKFNEQGEGNFSFAPFIF